MATLSPEFQTINYGLAPGALDENIDVESEEMLVNMGPQHSSTHGVLRIVLRTDGELVLEAVPHHVGGVTWDLPPQFLEKLTEFLDYSSRIAPLRHHVIT